MLVVPVLMGGVDPMLVLRMAVVLFATLFLSLSVGIACSAIFKSSKVVTGTALGIILFLNFGVGLIYEFLYEIFGREFVSGLSGIYSLFSTGNIYLLAIDGGLGLGGQADVEWNISMVFTGKDAEIESRIAQYEMAFRMQASIPEVTDISGESEKVLQSYGKLFWNTAAFDFLWV